MIRIPWDIQPVNLCFGQALVRTPGLNGVLDIQLTVAPTGQVRAIRVVRSTLGDPQLEGCITQAVRALEFPRPRSHDHDPGGGYETELSNCQKSLGQSGRRVGL